MLFETCYRALSPRNFLEKVKGELSAEERKTLSEGLTVIAKRTWRENEITDDFLYCVKNEATRAAMKKFSLIRPDWRFHEIDLVLRGIMVERVYRAIDISSLFFRGVEDDQLYYVKERVSGSFICCSDKGQPWFKELVKKAAAGDAKKVIEVLKDWGFLEASKRYAMAKDNVSKNYLVEVKEEFLIQENCYAFFGVGAFEEETLFLLSSSGYDLSKIAVESYNYVEFERSTFGNEEEAKMQLLVDVFSKSWHFWQAVWIRNTRKHIFHERLARYIKPSESLLFAALLVEDNINRQNAIKEIYRMLYKK